jgi:hypothetical protein
MQVSNLLAITILFFPYIISFINFIAPPFSTKTHRAKRFLFHSIKIGLYAGTASFIISLLGDPLSSSHALDAGVIYFISTIIPVSYFYNYNPYSFKEDGSFIDYFKERREEICALRYRRKRH